MRLCSYIGQFRSYIPLQIDHEIIQWHKEQNKELVRTTVRCLRIIWDSNRALTSSSNLPFLLAGERFFQPLSAKARPFAIRAASRALQERTKLCHNRIIHVGNGNKSSGIPNARHKIIYSFVRFSVPWFSKPDLKTFTMMHPQRYGYAPIISRWEKPSSLVGWLQINYQKREPKNGPRPIGRKWNK